MSYFFNTSSHPALPLQAMYPLYFVDEAFDCSLHVPLYIGIHPPQHRNMEQNMEFFLRDKRLNSS